jgi:hypothetical protein
MIRDVPGQHAALGAQAAAERHDFKSSPGVSRGVLA